MRKSPKERRIQYVQAQRITTIEAAIAIKAPPVMTFSAQMPAYTYTSLCPDLELREPPRPIPEHPEGMQPIGTGKICLMCRKHWPVDCKRENCDCEGQGHLFSMGVYYQRKVEVENALKEDICPLQP